LQNHCFVRSGRTSSPPSLISGRPPSGKKPRPTQVLVFLLLGRENLRLTAAPWLPYFAGCGTFIRRLTSDVGWPHVLTHDFAPLSPRPTGERPTGNTLPCPPKALSARPQPRMFSCFVKSLRATSGCWPFTLLQVRATSAGWRTSGRLRVGSV